MKNHRPWIVILILFALTTFSSCSPTKEPTPRPVEPTPAFDKAQPITLVTFKVHLLEPVAQSSNIAISILDEVTGLAVNPENHLMQSVDANTYTISLPFLVDSIVKYRYILSDTAQYQEHLSDGSPVRYRMVFVSGPSVVSDHVTQWKDTPATIQTGRMIGTIKDKNSGRGIPDLLITIGGDRALTRSDGNFLVEGIPPGTHNLVVYALDGSYTTFQQEATIASGSSTEAVIEIEPVPFVNITFDLVVPENTPQEMPIRLAGNLKQLGNTYADITGGVSAIASLMPVLSLQPDNHYKISISLPVGSDIRYKYTLGDGFWNSEHNQEGRFILRQLTVPQKDLVIKDEVLSWHGGNEPPIQFNVTVPPTTPPEESISIQFDIGYGWLHPMPMRKALENQGSTTWTFILFDPLQSSNQIHYRYCRQDQCGIADDALTTGYSSPGRSVQPITTPQIIDDSIEAWAWMEAGIGPATVPNVSVSSKGPDFVSGIALMPSHHPSWTPAYPSAIADISALNANFLLLQPTWTDNSKNPPIFGMQPGADILFKDLTRLIDQANQLQLRVGLYPHLILNEDQDEWWQTAERDFPWWNNWFKQYGDFILNFADLAAQHKVTALIVGGEWLRPALPGGLLSDGSHSGVPEDANERWLKLINDIRTHYSGQVIWALPYPEGLVSPPTFITQIDAVYISWDAKLSDNPEDSVKNLSANISQLLDTEILPFYQNINKAIILGIPYPAAQGSVNGCIPVAEGECLSFSALSQPGQDPLNITVDLAEQTDIYNALFLSVNERTWISGLISEEYYPPAILHDYTSSVHGKPAGGALWYWYDVFGQE